MEKTGEKRTPFKVLMGQTSGRTYMGTKYRPVVKTDYVSLYRLVEQGEGLIDASMGSLVRCDQ